MLTFSTFLGSYRHDILFSIYLTYILMQTVILPPNLWLKIIRKELMPLSRFSKVRTLLNSSVFAYFSHFSWFKLAWYTLQKILNLCLDASPPLWLKIKRKEGMPFSSFSRVRTPLNSSFFGFKFWLIRVKVILSLSLSYNELMYECKI